MPSPALHPEFPEAGREQETSSWHTIARLVNVHVAEQGRVKAMRYRFIDPIGLTEVESGDFVEIFCPYPGGEYTGYDGRTYDKTRGGQVTRIDVEVAPDRTMQALVHLDTDPADTEEETFVGTLVGGGAGNLVFGRGYIRDDGEDVAPCTPAPCDLPGTLEIQPLLITDVNLGDFVEVFCPEPDGAYQGHHGQAYDKVRHGQVTGFDMKASSDGWSQGVVFLDTDPGDGGGIAISSDPESLILGIGGSVRDMSENLEVTDTTDKTGEGCKPTPDNPTCCHEGKTEGEGTEATA